MLSVGNKELWQLAGLDCSGLLYEATGGWTPRNTSALVSFGKPVDINGLSADSIAGKIRPLDLIVWQGHLIIVLDHGEVIESRLYCDGRKNGVIIKPLKERLHEILSARNPSNSLGAKGNVSKKTFVIRRWDDNDVRPTPQAPSL